MPGAALSPGAGRAPHPVPYQGSKRLLAPRILGLLPERVGTLYEPFAGSAALSLAAASQGRAGRYVLNDSLEPLAGLWRAILGDPRRLADRYEAIWSAQLARPRAYFDEERARFNRSRDPASLLFLLARCVKNAVRFNERGEFNQSPDRRRLGARPERMRREIEGASRLLSPSASVLAGDYERAVEGAGPGDLVYMDPPYLGTSSGPDRRYHQPLDLGRLVAALRGLRRRGVPVVVSLDGRTGAKSYGPGLPGDLGLVRLELRAGRSSQATLLGRSEITVESLYVPEELLTSSRSSGTTGRGPGPGRS